ncbi:hypothetical protein [Actinacidiphila soli]|uniref:hypothetical protein n=1 Tax=Actinacidiphila soli TaxID=2487275 RepID=UPI000FC9EE10|nr:hypothetical protein [Actinacidiphila soli]
MAMPPFARLGVLRGEATFADTMHGLYAHPKSAEGGPGLYDTGSGLWYRDARFLPGGITSPNGLPVLWSARRDRRHLHSRRGCQGPRTRRLAPYERQAGPREAVRHPVHGDVVEPPFGP